MSATPLLYTAQDVARFCEVDLKTIHHWADAGKIPHHRTEGRHLRFRRNHIVQFLRAHGYPLPADLVCAKPSVFVALSNIGGVGVDEDGGVGGQDTSIDDLSKKLANRFFVRRFDSALSAMVHLAAAQPDAVVFSIDDPTLAGAHSLDALATDPATAWIVRVVVVNAAPDEEDASLSGADLVLPKSELARLPAELVKRLDVD